MPDREPETRSNAAAGSSRGVQERQAAERRSASQGVLAIATDDMMMCERIAGMTVNVMQMQAAGAPRANIQQLLTKQGLNPLTTNMVINTAASYSARNTQTAYAIARALCAMDMLKPFQGAE